MNIPLNIDWQQILLHVLNTAVLFCALYFLLYKPVKKFMDRRAEAYKKIDDDAKNNLAESERLKDLYEQKLLEADDEIKRHKTEAENEIARQIEQQLSAAREEAGRIVDAARADAMKEHDRIIVSANEEIEKLAADAAEKVVFSDTSEAYDTFLNTVEERSDNEQ